MAKIVHISTSFSASEGFRRLYKRLQAVHENGFEVILITGREFHPSPQWDMKPIEVIRLRSLVRDLDPAMDLMALVQLVRLLKRIRPAGIHTHLAKAGILGRWAAYLAGVPLVLHTVHGPTFPATFPLYKRAAYVSMEWITGRITDHFVFVGEELRREYVQRGVCRPDNSVVVRTGRPDGEIDALLRIGEEELACLRGSFLRNGDNTLIAKVGRIVPAKQQDHAIRVVHELRQRGIKAHLALVGEGFLKEEKGYKASLMDLTEKLGMTPHVTFTGHRDDALKIMAASDAILHTSSYEGLPNILVEGALAGRPVVTYSVSGAREVIRDGETGFIVKQGDIHVAAERLLQLAGQPLKAREMGLRARMAVSDEYRESRMIRSKVEFYSRLFGVPGREDGAYAAR